MYSQYSSRHSRRAGRRKKKSALYTNFHCDPDPWQGSPPQTPPSSDDESPAPVSVARNSSLHRSGAAVAKAVAVAPTLSTKNRGRRINSVKRKISKYVKMQNANVLQSRQPTRPQCTAPVPLPLFVKKKKTKKTAPVPMRPSMPPRLLQSKAKSKKKAKLKLIPRTERRAKAKRDSLCRPSMKMMQQQIAQISLEKKAKKRLVTANAPRNPPRNPPMPMPISTRPSPPPPIPLPTQITVTPPQMTEIVTVTPPRFDDDIEVDEVSEPIDLALIPDAYFIGYSHEAENRSMSQANGSREAEELDMMDINIAEIQNLQDLQQQQQQQQKQEAAFAMKPKLGLSPQSNGSLSGAEIIANVNLCVSGQSGNNLLQHQDSYNVLSDLTDFSISDGSHKEIEMELEREIEIEMELEPMPLEGTALPFGSEIDVDRIEMKTVGIDEGDENGVEDYFGDDKFNMLAQEIMFESEHPIQPMEQPCSQYTSQQPSPQRPQPQSFQMPPYQPYSQYTAGSSSTDYSYRYQCPVTQNIWAEPKRAQSAKTLAGLLMNGLEPISTKMFTL